LEKDRIETHTAILQTELTTLIVDRKHGWPYIGEPGSSSQSAELAVYKRT